jgi:replication factor A1
MIKIPYEEMLTKIIEKSSLPKKEIEEKIQTKLKQLSGLISKEGAAHIVANELGIALLESVGGRQTFSNIKPGMRNVEALGKVLNVYEVRTFQRDGREGKVGSMFVGDATGRMRIVCWGSLADKLPTIKQDDIVLVKGGYIKENNNFSEIHLNDRSTLSINPPGEEIEGEVAKPSVPQSIRKAINELGDTDANVEIIGHVVQVFDPRFFEVCPQCNKRVRNDSGAFLCPAHGEVEPSYSYVFNAILDDGTETIQTVFFRDQANQAAGKTTDEMLGFRTSPHEFNSVKNKLLGSQLKIKGRVSRNDMFDRKDFVANFVDAEIEAEIEIERL